MMPEETDDREGLVRDPREEDGNFSLGNYLGDEDTSALGPDDLDDDDFDDFEPEVEDDGFAAIDDQERPDLDDDDDYLGDDEELDETDDSYDFEEDEIDDDGGDFEYCG